jgi:hypothetical protein
MHLLHVAAETASLEPLQTAEVPSPLERAVRLAFGERTKLRDERDRLADDNLRLSSEVRRLADENCALREAARIWIRLYEKQLERANRSAQSA